MEALFRTVWQIALLRQPPYILPASTVLMWLVLGAHWFTGVLLALYNYPPGLAMFSALVGTLIMMAVVQTLLLLHRLQNRLLQTLTALAASEVLLGLLAIPLTAWFSMGGTAQDLATVLSLLLFGWNIAIAAHIFRFSLGVSMGMGFLFSVGYVLVSIGLGSFLVPIEG